MINWKVRFKNPVFYVQLLLAVLTPILAYMGLTMSGPTVGNVLLQAVSNPYILGLVVVSVWNAINDPTTSGVSDSSKALTYNKPNGE